MFCRSCLLALVLSWTSWTSAFELSNCARPVSGLANVGSALDLHCVESLGVSTRRSKRSSVVDAVVQSSPDLEHFSWLEREAASTRRQARQSVQLCDSVSCYALPKSCCEEESQVVTPVNATSAVSGKTVTVAQYPGLFIQTVVFSKCRYKKCAFVKGACRQKYSPYLLMTVHPPGPVSLFGQDYILIESGCACEPELTGEARAQLLSRADFINILTKELNDASPPPHYYSDDAEK